MLKNISKILVLLCFSLPVFAQESLLGEYVKKEKDNKVVMRSDYIMNLYGYSFSSFEGPKIDDQDRKAKEWEIDRKLADGVNKFFNSLFPGKTTEEVLGLTSEEVEQFFSLFRDREFYFAVESVDSKIQVNLTRSVKSIPGIEGNNDFEPSDYSDAIFKEKLELVSKGDDFPSVAKKLINDFLSNKAVQP